MRSPLPQENAWINLTVRLLPALAWMVVIFGLSARSTIPIPPGLGAYLTSLIGHFGSYFVLAALLWWGLGAVDVGDRRRLVIAFVVAVLYGISDEWHQSFVPGRTPDPLDVAVDALGAMCGMFAIQWASRRWPRWAIW